MIKASDCKCCECNAQAVTFWPVIDPDIPSYPYCADCLEKAMIDLANTMWKDDEGMKAIAVYQAKKTAEKLRVKTK